MTSAQPVAEDAPAPPVASPPPRHLKPRKRPRQARAAATVDAIFEATIQILVADGPARLTTTRVAKRAGVSVGTMYQYFPHKQALFYAVNERHLDILAGKIERACRAQHGTPIDRMVESLVTTYWNAKTERPDLTRALYRSVVGLDNSPLIDAFIRRVDNATAAMFASALDATFADLPIVNLTLLTSIFATVRSAFERNLPALDGRAVHQQLILMCSAYLEAAKLSPGRVAATVVTDGDRRRSIRNFGSKS
jgi:AcrR family transcriptional regulator